MASFPEGRHCRWYRRVAEIRDRKTEYSIGGCRHGNRNGGSPSLDQSKRGAAYGWVSPPDRHPCPAGHSPVLRLSRGRKSVQGTAAPGDHQQITAQQPTNQESGTTRRFFRRPDPGRRQLVVPKDKRTAPP